MHRLVVDAIATIDFHLRRSRTLIVVGVAALMLLATTAGGAAIQVGQKDNGWSKTDERYQLQYEQCVAANGCDYGRNLLDDGLSNGDPASEKRLEEAWTVMDRQLHPAKYAPPPAPEPVAAPATTDYSTTTTTPTTAAPTTSSGGCPSYMAAEAGSPDAVNPTSGASGCYQVLPSTAAAYGSACSDVNADSCVAAICASEGNGAWAASGATPCDYVTEP